MDQDDVSQVIKEADSLLEKGVLSLRERAKIPMLGGKSEKERYDWMLEESRLCQKQTDACLRSWLDQGEFPSCYGEEVARQAFWRLVAADDYLPYTGEPILLDRAADRSTPQDVLEFLLLDYWQEDGGFAEEYFQYLAAGERKFRTR